MQKTPTLRIGEVWDVEFGPVIGHDQGGRRPALIISNDGFNITPHGLCIVVPITGTDRGIQLQVPVEPPEGGISKRSMIMPEQAKSVSILRIKKYRGVVSSETLQRVQAVVGLFIDRM